MGSEILAIELGQLIDLLPAEGFDVSLTGFEVPEIDLLLADMAPSRPAPEDILPALPRNPTTRRGDLWLLGKHRLLCGDAREVADFARLIEGALAPPLRRPRQPDEPDAFNKRACATDYYVSHAILQNRKAEAGTSRE